MAVYLALPTALLAPTFAALAETQLPQGSRVAVEKPFGEDLDSARKLNGLPSDALGDWKAAAALRSSKTELLQAVRPLSADEVVRRTRRARYSTGRLAAAGGADGRTVPDYAEESGVDPERGTETFAEVVLDIDTTRWSGTRFVLRAGKALSERRKGVRVHFRPVPGAPGNELWVGIDGPGTRGRVPLQKYAAGSAGPTRE